MTGPEHYRAAEVALKRATEEAGEDLCYKLQGIAQVHATLAVAAATADAGRLAERHPAWMAVPQ